MNLRFKEVFKEEGLTVQEVADKLGITRVGLSQHINGNPSAEVIERISKVTNVPMWRFFASKEEVLEQDPNTITCPKCGAKFEFKEE